MSGEAIPVLLTVEEAGRLLRIGRTKAYAMAREWRETDGRSGLPVIDLGHVLRVPRRALEELIGAELREADGHTHFEKPTRAESPKRRKTEPAGETPPRPAASTGRSRGRLNRIANQLDLFDPKSRSG